MVSPETFEFFNTKFKTACQRKTRLRKNAWWLFGMALGNIYFCQLHADFAARMAARWGWLAIAPLAAQSSVTVFIINGLVNLATAESCLTLSRRNPVWHESK